MFPRLLVRHLGGRPQQTARSTRRTRPHERIIPVRLSYASYESSEPSPTTAPPPLLIMHGLFGSKNNWNSISRYLHENTQPQRRVLALDARNHGDSPHTAHHTYDHMAADVRALLEKLRIEKCCVLGHSMGGRAMMLLALRYPELVERMIVADISPVPSPLNLKTVPTLFSSLQKVDLPSNIPISLARCSADIQLSTSIMDKGLRSFLLTNLVQKSDGSFTWRVNIEALKNNFNRHISVFPQVKDLTFDGPVLFVGGQSTNFIDKADHPAIKKLFPKAEFEYIEGSGQWIHSDNPQEFLKVCMDFLNRPSAEMSAQKLVDFPTLAVAEQALSEIPEEESPDESAPAVINCPRSED